MNKHWSLNKSDHPKELLEFVKNNVTVVIPTLNESASLDQVITESKKYCNNILIVDGHSNDNTKNITIQHDVSFVLDNKKGKGDAIRVSINHIATPVVIFIDADMSHDPNDIPKLIKPIYENKADHVIGSRPRGGSDELHGDFEKFLRMIGSDIITLGINYRFNVRLTDSQNGFRAVKTDVLKNLNLKENITTIEQEMTIKTLRKGFIIQEVPSHEYARKYGDSHISLRRVSFRYVYSWLKYLFL